MQKSGIQILRTGFEADPLVDPARTSRGKLRKFANMALGVVKGNSPSGGSVIQRHTAAAFATFTATTSGDFTVTINGVDTVVAFDTSQTVTASNAVTALNALTANALVYGGRTIEADNRAATYTLTSTAAGTTLYIGSYALQAVAKAASYRGQWEISGNDTADAGTLVVAINTMPGLQDLVVASNSAGVVTIRSRRASTPARDLAVRATAESLSAGVLTAGTVVCVSAVVKGVAGNWITTAVSGTGSAVSGARMTGGTTAYETL